MTATAVHTMLRIGGRCTAHGKCQLLTTASITQMIRVSGHQPLVRLSTAYLAKYALVERLERPKDSAGKDSTLGGKGAALRRNRDINWLKTLISNKILREIFIPAELHKCGEQNFTSIFVCCTAVDLNKSQFDSFPNFFFDLSPFPLAAVWAGPSRFGRWRIIMVSVHTRNGSSESSSDPGRRRSSLAADDRPGPGSGPAHL